MRKYYIILIGLLSSVCLSGCTFCTKSAVRQALKDRYDQDFTITEYSHYFFPNILWQEGTDTYMAYPDNNPDIRFTGTAVSMKEEDVTDTYVTWKVCNKMEQLIEENIGDVGFPYIVYVQPQFTYTEITDPDISIQDFIDQDGNNSYHIYLFSTKKIAREQVLDVLSGTHGITGEIDLYKTDELEKIKEYIQKHEVLYSDFFEDLAEEGYLWEDISNSTYYLKNWNG